MREDSEDKAEEEPEEPEAATLSARDAMELIAPNGKAPHERAGQPDERDADE
jgi:hypothetical protein